MGMMVTVMVTVMVIMITEFFKLATPLEFKLYLGEERKWMVALFARR